MLLFVIAACSSNAFALELASSNSAYSFALNF